MKIVQFFANLEARSRPLPHAVTIGVQAVVIDNESRILLVRHRYRRGWYLPGGGVERNETVQDAIARELHEEAGIVLTGCPKLFAIYSHFDVFPGDHVVIFIVDSWNQPRVPGANHEIAERGFFARDALPEGVTAGTRRRLAEVFLGGRPAEAW